MSRAATATKSDIAGACSQSRGTVLQAHGGLGFTVFSIMLHHHFPGLCDADQPHSDRPYRIFKALDTDGDGFLNYAEFCCGMSVLLRGSPHDRLRLIYNVMNRQGEV